MDPHRQPLPEIARTDVRTGAARLFVAACLLSLLSVPLFQHVLPSGDGPPEGGQTDNWGLRAGPFDDFVATAGSISADKNLEAQSAWARFFGANRALKQGMDDLERELERISHVHEQTYPIVQWLLLAYGGTGNERVYLGADGWLYLRAGFDYLTGPPFLDPDLLRRRRLDAPAWQPAPEPDPRPAILDFAQQLESRGIRLLILPAPTKAMVHPEPLAARRSADPSAVPHNPSFATFRAELEAAGVTVFDPAPAMIQARAETGQDQFLRTDSHWSPAGLDAVAGALADRIRQLELPFAGTDSKRWRRRERPVEGTGDLQRIMLLPPWQKLFASQTATVQRVVSASGPWRSDPRAEILLLGDSFTNVYSRTGGDVEWGISAGLAEQLSYFSGRPLDRLAVNAVEVSASRQRLADELSDGKDRLAGKKLVIFQFAVRDLAVGDWQLVDFAASGTDREVGLPPPAGSGSGRERFEVAIGRSAEPVPKTRAVDASLWRLAAGDPPRPEGIKPRRPLPLRPAAAAAGRG